MSYPQEARNRQVDKSLFTKFETLGVWVRLARVGAVITKVLDEEDSRQEKTLCGTPRRTRNLAFKGQIP